MIVLGVDPGTRCTGTGIVASEDAGYELIHCEAFHPSPRASVAERLFQIHSFITRLILKYRPEVMAIENIFFGQNIQTMLRIGEVRAAAMLAAYECGLAVVEYPPARVKESVSGNGRANKEQIQNMVRHLLHLPSQPVPDAADALAVALCHLHSLKEVKLSVPNSRSFQ